MMANSSSSLRFEADVLFGVAPLQPFQHQPAQKGGRHGAVRRGVIGELRFAQPEGECATLGNLAAMPGTPGERQKAARSSAADRK